MPRDCAIFSLPKNSQHLDLPAVLYSATPVTTTFPDAKLSNCHTYVVCMYSLAKLLRVRYYCCPVGK